ncbi:MAG TPA: hypothetical protein VGN75_06780 [Kaistia sp.]|jgi:hypothetical protein|nr:hypothetical protein [Kaistia sp.]
MTWKQSRSGLAIDLVDPDLSAIHIRLDIAVPLSLINRFDGHAGRGEQAGYSVAQHCIKDADAILHETGGDTDAALAFLLHDAHEVFSGDITTPVAESLDRMALDTLGRPANGIIRRAIKTMKARLDAEIYKRLGLGWPLSAHRAHLVADMDLRMLRAERDELMRPAPKPWGNAIETALPIPNLGWRDFLSMRPADVQGEWIHRLMAWHPTPESLSLEPEGAA